MECRTPPPTCVTWAILGLPVVRVPFELPRCRLALVCSARRFGWLLQGCARRGRVDRGSLLCTRACGRRRTSVMFVEVGDGSWRASLMERGPRETRDRWRSAGDRILGCQIAGCHRRRYRVHTTEGTPWFPAGTGRAPRMRSGGKVVAVSARCATCALTDRGPRLEGAMACWVEQPRGGCGGWVRRSRLWCAVGRSRTVERERRDDGYTGR